MQFVVANDPELDFDLLQEAWQDDHLLADLRYVDGEWQVTFFSDDRRFEVPWAQLAEIHKRFGRFIKEQKDKP
ncbi:MAG: hypothetical protein L0177_13885 [Chloroflexi bacterium]|nr:hypothetical protein [Chloroflexota bacterium]